ncbi:MAG: beta-glucuronidase, partial [Oscillospiraceae bacterium]|nr:beta-glucuronidase [Oscillospiraceae bacterium]
YFMYPDYGEIEKYTGVLKPYNLEIFRERLEKAGLAHLADKYFRASGRFAAECYKNEIETALRSKELSGFQLLDIQDFTGQGTALVGILNSFMESKGIITAIEWRNFCSDRVLLGCLSKFVFVAGETVSMGVKLYNYAQKADVDPTVTIKLSVDGEVVSEQNISAKGNFKGGVFDLGSAELIMPNVERAEKVVLNLSYKDICNKYILWVYPNISVTSSVTTDWNTAKAELLEGKSVLFIPKNLDEENSVEGFYCTDFWNYPMFRSISESMKKPVPTGTLGLLIDKKHPALESFPTESYSTAGWYDIVSCSRTAILDGTGIEPIVRTIDNCERNHSLGTIFEVKAGGGKLLVCTAALDEQKNSLPCGALLKSLSEYVSSEKFEPAQTVEIDVLDKIFG